MLLLMMLVYSADINPRSFNRCNLVSFRETILFYLQLCEL